MYQIQYSEYIIYCNLMLNNKLLEKKDFRPIFYVNICNKGQ